MKHLIDYILEHDEELNLQQSIEYDKFAELLLYIKNSDLFMDRLQAICDVFRHNYNDNLSCNKLINSKIFDKFIDDSIIEYNKNVDNKIELNIGTKIHLCDEIAAWMLPKIKLELEKLQDTSDIESEN